LADDNQLLLAMMSGSNGSTATDGSGSSKGAQAAIDAGTNFTTHQQPQKTVKLQQEGVLAAPAAAPALTQPPAWSAPVKADGVDSSGGDVAASAGDSNENLVATLMAAMTRVSTE